MAKRRVPAPPPPPGLPRITPIRFVERPSPFDDPNCIFELKYDGFRAVAYVEGGSAKLVSRRGNTYKHFDDLGAGIGSSVRGKDAVLDGEIVCLDEEAARNRPTPRSMTKSAYNTNGRSARDDLPQCCLAVQLR
jgi:ATP-dependent DNA ligase